MEPQDHPFLLAFGFAMRLSDMTLAGVDSGSAREGHVPSLGRFWTGEEEHFGSHMAILVGLPEGKKT